MAENYKVVNFGRRNLIFLNLLYRKTILKVRSDQGLEYNLKTKFLQMVDAKAVALNNSKSSYLVTIKDEGSKSTTYHKRILQDETFLHHVVRQQFLQDSYSQLLLHQQHQTVWQIVWKIASKLHQRWEDI